MADRARRGARSSHPPARPLRARVQDTDTPGDAELVERLAGGDTDALAVLYRRYARACYSLARRVCGDDGLAEEVVQEVLLTVWREPRRYDAAKARFATWLLTLIHHKAVDAVRRENTTRRRTVSAGQAGEEWSPTPAPGADDAVLLRVAADQVQRALHQLPVEQRQALTLAYYGGHTQREVAVLVGVPLGTIKSRMFAGVQRLRSLLEPEFLIDQLPPEGVRP